MSLFAAILCIKAKDICFLTVVQLSNGNYNILFFFNCNDLYDLDFVHEFCSNYMNNIMINEVCTSFSKMTHCNVCHLLVKACPWQNKEEENFGNFVDNRCNSPLVLQECDKVIHPKYYKHSKKVIWADKKWAGFWQIHLHIKYNWNIKQNFILNFEVNLECFFTQKWK